MRFVQGGQVPLQMVRWIAAKSEHRPQITYDDCPDSKMVSSGKYWMLTKGNKVPGSTTCFPGHASGTIKENGRTYSSQGYDDSYLGKGAVIITKSRFSKAGRKDSFSSGMWMFKRVVRHPSADGLVKADVFKVGFCVKCKKAIYNVYNQCDNWPKCQKGGKHKKGGCICRQNPRPTEAEVTSANKKFAEQCFKGAIDPKKHEVEEAFRCSKEDENYAMTTLAAF